MTSEASSPLQARHLSIGYRPSKGAPYCVHPDLSFSLRAGEVTALLGANGAGKSTLLRTLAGFQSPLGGEVILAGAPLESVKASTRARLLGVVLTERSVSGGLRVRDLVALGRYPYTHYLGGLSSHDEAMVERAMASVAITHKADAFIDELSDGERQKAMIAKVLAQECPIILLDEPTAFLDVTNRIELMILLRQLALEEGKAILLSTHDIELALSLADRLWLMMNDSMRREADAGTDTMFVGTPEELVLSGVIGRYFGRREVMFDPLLGRLVHRATSQRPIIVQCDDEQIAYWLANALRRAGYSPQVGALCPDASAPILAPTAADALSCSNADPTPPSIRYDAVDQNFTLLRPDHPAQSYASISAVIAAL